MKKVALIFLLCLTTSFLYVQANESTPSAIEIEIHQLVNEERSKSDQVNSKLLKLRLHSVLIEIARSHSQDMLENNYFAHVNLQGQSASDRIRMAGVDADESGENLFVAYAADKENIADSAVEGWVDSPGHYQNMMSPFRFTGIGVATDGEDYYVTQIFVNADETHLQEIGTIYDNDNLDQLIPEESSFTLRREYIIVAILILVVIIGIDAQRRNRLYIGRRFRRNVR